MANETYWGTAGTSASGFTTIFAYRYNYLQIQNVSANAIYFTTDNKTAPLTAGGDGIFEVPGNTTLLVPNLLPLWYPSATVIPKGTELGNGPLTGTPYEVGTPYGSSLWGQTADPGTIINFISGTASSGFVVTGTG